ncbi:ClpP/crotonase-like domain-containing protein [Zychaea mexicana]|uniref:ClpP/crotonase-like domain-containing protein n=1 Tax=Zychaea mexicana TaxID=64656 RepID=UPI0022FE5EF6|nr:ClpP/crotonase-like domain-containing protein [Zychaea mexicana]KAI9498620.1 ClpP/crotonase-like domain-containing protein [Zychaea mexicana]
MSSEPEVLISVANHVATVTLNRPRKGNALTAGMNTILLDALPKLAVDPDVRVLVLTGSGKFFCTGMDLSANRGSVDPEQVKGGFFKGRQVYDLLNTFPKPVIARINGPALGGGVGLIFTADIRVAVDNAYFALTEVKRGIIPAIISQFIVPELGKHKTREYMLTGRRVPASEGAGSFLTATVSSQDELDAKVKSYIEMLVDSAPDAMADIKKLIDMVGSGGDKDQHARVQKGVEDAYVKMMQSDEAAYGIMSFLSKQKPDWNQFLKDKAKL